MKNIHFVILLVFFSLIGLNRSLSQSVEVPLKYNFQNVEWAPDNKSLVFSGILVRADWSDYQNKKWQVFHLNLETGAVKRLADGAVYASFSPDGQQVGFGKWNPEGDTDIEVYDLATGQTTHLSNLPGDEGAPSWSPDGRQIAFHVKEKDKYELYIMDAAAGSTPHKITNLLPLGALNPVWSPQGDQILFYSEKGDRRDQICLTDPSGSFLKNITGDTLHNIFPGWTPEGNIVYTMRNSVRLIRPDGGHQQILDGVQAFYARISPDGKKIAFLRQGDSPALVVQDYPVSGAARIVFSKVEYDAWQKARYYCAPCSCEHDDHLFDEPGICPSCQMRLLPVGKKKLRMGKPLPGRRTEVRGCFFTRREKDRLHPNVEKP